MCWGKHLLFFGSWEKTTFGNLSCLRLWVFQAVVFLSPCGAFRMDDFEVLVFRLMKVDMNIMRSASFKLKATLPIPSTGLVYLAT